MLDPDVAVRSRVRPTGTQAFERIDDEWKRLQIDVDGFDRLRRRDLVDGGDGENRFARVERLHGERSLSLLVRLDHRAEVGEAVGGRGKVVRRQDRLDAGHRERSAGVDFPHARVRHRAEQQLAEQHSFGAKVLGGLAAKTLTGTWSTARAPT